MQLKKLEEPCTASLALGNFLPSPHNANEFLSKHLSVQSSRAPRSQNRGVDVLL